MRVFHPQGVGTRVVLTGCVRDAACHGGDGGVVADYQWRLENASESDIITSCNAGEHAFDLVGVGIVEEGIVEGGTLEFHGFEMLEGLSYGGPD